LRPLSSSLERWYEGFLLKDAHVLHTKIIEMFGPERCVWESDFPTEFWVEKAGVSEALDTYQ
jgi:predicted TIM-barrel fold metal-dependent hydrolase